MAAHAQNDGYYSDFYGPFQPPLSLPQGLRATIRVPVAEVGNSQPVDTLRALFPALAACWRAPDDMQRNEVTLRFALRRDGSVIGTPRVTFSQALAGARGKAIAIEAGLSAIRHCTPVRITRGLGGAIAGKPLALRFVYDGPRGRGA